MKVDYVIVGRGLAGSAAAYGLSRLGDVAMLSKASFTGTNSYHAQGGIAAAIAQTDTTDAHYLDTVHAGGGLCQKDSVSLLVRRAPELMDWLVDLGVPFNRDSAGHLSLGLEGAHSHPRILHAGGDATGRYVMETLADRLNTCETVQAYDDVQVTSLIKDVRNRVVGVMSIHTPHPDRKILWIARKAVVLATGGAGQLFRYSTNPPGATGEGIALAFEAGAEIRNMEFVQFHPTALLIPGQSPMLISEAVRGAGARLVDERGIPILERSSDDLGPRDMVARAIDEHYRDVGPVFLDTTTITHFERRFPTIYATCAANEINPSVTPIPVSPAAHFLMGGIRASMSGRTSVNGLYAIGEVACTGVHGANRLASNSLLECLVMAHQLTKHLSMRATRESSSPIPSSAEVDAEDGFLPDDNLILSEVRQILWDACGIVRHQGGLEHGLKRLAEVGSRYPRSTAVLVATLIASCAIARRESRGAHFRSDFPFTEGSIARDSVLSKSNFNHKGDECRWHWKSMM